MNYSEELKRSIDEVVNELVCDDEFAIAKEQLKSQTERCRKLLKELRSYEVSYITTLNKFNDNLNAVKRKGLSLNNANDFVTKWKDTTNFESDFIQKVDEITLFSRSNFDYLFKETSDILIDFNFADSLAYYGRQVKQNRDAFAYSIEVWAETYKAYYALKLKQLEKPTNHNKEMMANKLLNTYESITNNPMTEGVEFDLNNIKVYTKEMKCYFDYDEDNEVDHYAIVGPFEIWIPYDRRKTIKLYCTDEDNIRPSYWGSECHHPHVSEEGTACFGTTSEFIADAYNIDDYNQVYIGCLMFLQQADYNDCAGRCVVNWDCYDLDGNSEDIVTRCKSCGRVIYDGNYYTCEDCGEPVCEECITYIEDRGIYVCPSCADDNYYECEYCGGIYEDVKEVDELHYCNGCFDRKVYDGCIIQCCNCGEYHHEEDMTYDEESELYYCAECYEECVVNREGE